MNIINETMYSFANAINKQIDIDLVLTTITDCNLWMESLENMQKNIISLMWNSKGNFIEKILPFTEFQEQIAKMRLNLNGNLKLPDLDPIVLGQSAIITTRMTNSTLLFNIKFPLIQKSTLQLFALHAYPTWHDGYFVSIETNANYIAVDEQKMHYGMLTEAEFHKCKRLEEIWICHITGPLYNVYTASRCEINLFLDNKIDSKCKIRIAPPTQFWKQLFAYTTWIYSLRNKTTINISCNSNTSRQTITGQGMIQLAVGCTLQTIEFIYTSYEDKYSAANILWPTINLTDELPTHRYVKFNGEMEVFKIPDIPTTQSLFKMQYDWEINVHDIWHYIMSFSNMIMLITGIIIITIIWRQFCQSSRNVIPINGFNF